MGTIYKRGKVWYYDVRVEGKRQRTKIGASKKDAETVLKDIEGQIVRREFRIDNKEVRVDDFIAKYFEDRAAKLSPQTIRRYRPVFEHFMRFLAGRADKVRLSQLNAQDLDGYVTMRKSEWVNPNGAKLKSGDESTVHTRKGATNKTINFELTTLGNLFNFAIKWDYLRENPVQKIEKLKVDARKTPRYLSIEECQLLLASSPQHLRPIFYTFINTGMRKGELENLEWTDLDFNRGIIKIQNKEDWHTKTGEREVPMTQGLRELFTRLKKENEKGLKSKYVFPHKDGGRTKTRLREKLIAIAKEVGIPNLTRLHTLRHTFASQCIMNGIDLPTLQKYLGHMDIQTTMLYAHLAPEHKAKEIEKLGAVLGKLD